MDENTVTSEEAPAGASDTSVPEAAPEASTPAIIPMTKQAIREAAANHKAKMENLDTPFWPELDGQLAIRDVPTPQLTAIQKISEKDPVRYMAHLMSKALVSRHTGERPFENEKGVPDESILLDLGGSITVPIMEKINAFFGFVKGAKEDAKKNS